MPSKKNKTTGSIKQGTPCARQFREAAGHQAFSAVSSFAHLYLSIFSSKYIRI
jgi:hypothetical protein